jgi:hypothetical protein
MRPWQGNLNGCKNAVGGAGGGGGYYGGFNGKQKHALTTKWFKSKQAV